MVTNSDKCRRAAEGDGTGSQPSDRSSARWRYLRVLARRAPCAGGGKSERKAVRAKWGSRREDEEERSSAESQSKAGSGSSGLERVCSAQSSCFWLCSRRWTGLKRSSLCSALSPSLWRCRVLQAQTGAASARTAPARGTSLAATTATTASAGGAALRAAALTATTTTTTAIGTAAGARTTVTGRGTEARSGNAAGAGAGAGMTGAGGTARGQGRGHGRARGTGTGTTTARAGAGTARARGRTRPTRATTGASPRRIAGGAGRRRRSARPGSVTALGLVQALQECSRVHARSARRSAEPRRASRRSNGANTASSPKPTCTPRATSSRRGSSARSTSTRASSRSRRRRRSSASSWRCVPSALAFHVPLAHTGPAGLQHGHAAQREVLRPEKVRAANGGRPHGRDGHARRLVRLQQGPRKCVADSPSIAL